MKSRHHYETTKDLTSVVSLEHNKFSMAQAAEIVEQLKRRLRHECVRIREVRTEMEPLADAYNRYRDLEQELKARDKSVERLLGTLGDQTGLDALMRQADVPEMDIAAVVVGDLSLWESIQQILLIAGELREVEIYDILETLGHDTSTSAIQSALRTHPEVFKIRIRGRKKFVSLK